MADRVEPRFPEESRVTLALWFFPLLVSVVTPGLIWIVAERPFAARSELAIGMTVAIGVVALSVLAILSRGFRHRIRWSLGLTSVVVLTLFQWPTLTLAGRTIAHSLPIPLLADVFPVMLATGFLWVATRRAQEWPFAAITGVGGMVVVVVLMATALPYVVRTPATPAAAPAAADSPDVLLLILDGYTRADILEEQFEFDNTPFIADLEALGFAVADEARPNYGFTYASIATMLDLDYVYDLGEISPGDHERMRNALSGNPALVDLFQQAGYEVAYTENAWQGSHCPDAIDICIRDGLAERVLWNIGQSTIFAPALKAVRPHPFNTISLEHLESLPAFIDEGRTEGVPRLTIAHIILPHPPFLLDAQCSRQNTAIRRAFTTPSVELIENRRRFYTDQMVCTNQKVVESLDRIIEARADTIVMITGDHGSGSTRLANLPVDEWTDEGVQERMSILSAYRTPDCQHHPYPAITPVNGARTITDCALGTNLGFVPDRYWWAPSDGKGAVTDVAGRLEG